MTYLLSSLVFVFGAIIGSFLNVVILRLPKEESLNGRSHCNSCKHTLSFLDLFPFFSYLFLGGKCRYCNAKISPRYFIIEALTGILFLLSFWFLMPDTLIELIRLLSFWVILSTLITVFVIDLEHFLILDEIIFPMGLVVLALNIISDLLIKNSLLDINSQFLSGLLAALLGAAPFFCLWYFSKGLWLGFGDVKFALFLGLALGMPNIFVGLMVSILLGGILSAILLIFTKSNLKTKLPFGTFLSVGSAMVLFYGPTMLNWYLSILGI